MNSETQDITEAILLITTIETKLEGMLNVISKADTTDENRSLYTILLTILSQHRKQKLILQRVE